MRANREGFDRYQIRARRLVDVSKIDTSVTLFGKTWETPIFLSPVSGHRTYNPDGELATARAAQVEEASADALDGDDDLGRRRERGTRRAGVVPALSRGRVGQTRRAASSVSKRRAVPALVFTVDLLGGPQHGAVLARAAAQPAAVRRVSQRQAVDRSAQPADGEFAVASSPGSKPEIGTPTWDYVKRLKDTTGMKLLVKGIVTREDAELAMQHGVDGVFVSNHGGRADNTHALDD